MTSSTNRASLIERLEAENPFRISNDGMTVAELPPPGKLRNPDGPEAAALIRNLLFFRYVHDPVGTARYCDEELDPSGKLLGEIRELAIKASKL